MAKTGKKMAKSITINETSPSVPKTTPVNDQNRLKAALKFLKISPGEIMGQSVIDGIVTIATKDGQKYKYNTNSRKKPDLPPELKRACDKSRINYEAVYFDERTGFYSWANKDGRVSFVTNDGQKHLV